MEKKREDMVKIRIKNIQIGLKGEYLYLTHYSPECIIYVNPLTNILYQGVDIDKWLFSIKHILPETS